MKKKHGNETIKGNKCPHCGEVFPSVIAVHQHILDDHQQIVAEERETQAMERLQKEQEKAEKDRQREENRRRREERRRERMDYNDFRPKGMKEWEINYEVCDDFRHLLHFSLTSILISVSSRRWFGSWS